MAEEEQDMPPRRQETYDAQDTAEEIRSPAPITLVPFYEDVLQIVHSGGKEWVVLRPVCERFSLSMEGQLAKLKKAAWACLKIIFMQLPGDRQAREVTCLELRCLGAWLLS